MEEQDMQFDMAPIGARMLAMNGSIWVKISDCAVEREDNPAITQGVKAGERVSVIPAIPKEIVPLRIVKG